MLCAKYQEAGLCGSREKCDRNYLVSKFAYIHNIQSRVNRKWTCRRFKNVLHNTVHYTDALCQISGSWPLWFPEKNVTEIFCDADAERRQKWSLYVASAKAGRRHNYTCMYYVEFTSKLVLTHLLKSRLLQLALLSLALRHRKHISPQHCYKNISERNVQRLFSRRFNKQHVIQYAGFFAHACTYKFMRKWTAFLFFKEILNY